MNNYIQLTDAQKQTVLTDDLWRETDLFGADKKHKGVGKEVQGEKLIYPRAFFVHFFDIKKSHKSVLQ